MSPHDLPGELKPKKFLRALERAGFRLDETGGKGSHVKAIWRNEKSVTIPRRLHRSVLRYVLKEIQSIAGLTWDDIAKEL